MHPSTVCHPCICVPIHPPACLMQNRLSCPIHPPVCLSTLLSAYPLIEASVCLSTDRFTDALACVCPCIYLSIHPPVWLSIHLCDPSTCLPTVSPFLPAFSIHPPVCLSTLLPADSIYSTVLHCIFVCCRTNTTRWIGKA